MGTRPLLQPRSLAGQQGEHGNKTATAASFPSWTTGGAWEQDCYCSLVPKLDNRGEHGNKTAIAASFPSWTTGGAWEQDCYCSLIPKLDNRGEHGKKTATAASFPSWTTGGSMGTRLLLQPYSLAGQQGGAWEQEFPSWTTGGAWEQDCDLGGVA